MCDKSGHPCILATLSWFHAQVPALEVDPIDAHGNWPGVTIRRPYIVARIAPELSEATGRYHLRLRVATQAYECPDTLSALVVARQVTNIVDTLAALIVEEREMIERGWSQGEIAEAVRLHEAERARAVEVIHTLTGQRVSTPRGEA